MRNEKYKFPLVDIIGSFVIETCLISKECQNGSVATSDIYLLDEWKRAEKERKKDLSKPYEILGFELELYKTKKKTIIGHKKYVELEKRGELQVF